MVRALDLQFARQLGLEFKSSATLVNSQLVCLRPVGILNPVKLDLDYLFQASAHECYKYFIYLFY